MSKTPEPGFPIAAISNPHKRQPVSEVADATRHEAMAAERVLLGAMLRDVHRMPEVIAGLNVVALTNHTPFTAKSSKRSSGNSKPTAGIHP